MPVTKKKIKSASSDSDHKGSGIRPRLSDLPPLTSAATPVAEKLDLETEARLHALLTAVSQEDGFTYPPAWAPIADVAKRRGYLDEHGLKLYMKAHGKQWLAQRASPVSSSKTFTMTKVDPNTRLRLKDLSHDTGVPMQEAIGDIIGAIHEHRDELTRYARRVGLSHPWEAVGALLRAARKG